MTFKICLVSFSILTANFLIAPWLLADGKVIPPRSYQGSLEEKAQEAIIIFQASEIPGEASEDLILKIQVVGNAREFAWVIPFPNPPKFEKEDAALFKDIFDYVQHRKTSSHKKSGTADKAAEGKSDVDSAVQVIERRTVGDFDVAIVKEIEQGGLNPWLEQEGFQTLDNAEDVLTFYRNKKYVFACIKVTTEALESEKQIDLHPLRFSFQTGGRDGIYFPMKMTGLQQEPFDVNLYIFYRFWINDRKSKFGYEHRGFGLVYRDWDSDDCEANAGKSYSLPSDDPFLKNFQHYLKSVTQLMQKLHPGEKYYLTNIQARQLKPEDVRQWADDLWLFPYYTNKSAIPYDVRDNGPASAAWPNEVADEESGEIAGGGSSLNTRLPLWISLIAIAMLALLVVGFFTHRHIRRLGNYSKTVASGKTHDKQAV